MVVLGRHEAVAQWVFERARARGDANYESVDIASFNLPLLDVGHDTAVAGSTA